MASDLFSLLRLRGLGGECGVRDTAGFCPLPELEARALELAAWLQARHIRRLGLHARNGIPWAVADLAAQVGGIILVPLPVFFSAAQLRHVIDAAGLRAVLTDAPNGFVGMSDGRAQSRCPVASLELLKWQGEEPPAAIPAGTGKITFTSGSTGAPKGVCLANAQLLRQATTLDATIALDGPRHLCLLPLTTLLENLAGLYAPLLAGGEALVPNGAELGMSGSRLASPEKLLSLIARTRPHTLILMPELLGLLVTASRHGWKTPDSLRFVAVGGARVAPALLREARERGIPAYEGYGLSECASVVSLNTPWADSIGSGGQVLPDLNVTVEAGELVVEGRAMLGYLGEPESWGQQKVRTGDLGYVDGQGFVRLAGRRKNLLISSYGRNISPEWVEGELLDGGVVSEALVFGDGRPWCVALLSAPASVSEALIQDWIDEVNACLPDYARILGWHRQYGPLAQGEGLRTDNGRPRRDAILAAYGREIDALYTCGRTNSQAPGMLEKG